MKKFLGNAPFLRIMLLVIAGIICQTYVHIHYLIIGCAIISCAGLNVISFYSRNHQALFKYRYGLGVSVLLFLFTLGMSLVELQEIPHYQAHYYDHFLPSKPTLITFRVLINGDLQASKNGLRSSAEVIAIDQDSITEEVGGKLNLFFSDSTCIEQIHFGDIVSIAAQITPIGAVQIPHEFDAQKFYQRKNIYYQSFVSTGNFQVIDSNRCGRLAHFIYVLRSFIAAKFEQHMHNTAAIGVCKALLLGIEDDLDTNLLKAYASSGVIHVLSVSGLHVGIFYIIISYLFSFIRNDSRLVRWFKAIISLALVWFYALLSGFSPSVLRSAVMLSTVIMAATLNRKISIYNSLSASCFILLCFNANYIFDVGFQLSYLAVFGIVYLQKKLYLLFDFKNYLLDKIWNMTAVSLSAQWVTFPLSVYYFYQFPALFLFANLIVLPIVSITLPLGFLFMFACLFRSDVLLHYLAIPLEYTIIWTNTIIIFFDHIPFNSIKPLFFTLAQLILVYSLMFVMAVSYELKNVRYLLLGLCLSALILSMFIVEKYECLQQHKLLVYNIRNTQRIELIDANSATIFSDKSDSSIYAFKIRPNHIFSRVSLLNYLDTATNNKLLQWNRNSIAIINKPIVHQFLCSHYDYIIVGHNAIPPDTIIKYSNCSADWIFDSSNSIKYINLLKNSTILRYHATKTDPTLVIELHAL